MFLLLHFVQLYTKITFLDPEGSLSATTVVLLDLVVTPFEKCLSLC